MRSVQLNAGDVLYREGEVSDAVYFVEDGELEVRRVSDAGSITLAALGKGEILGEMGVVRSRPRSASIVATTQATLSRIDGPTFIEAFGGPDGLALKLLRMVCNRLSVANSGGGAAALQEHASWDEIDDARLLGDSPEMSLHLGNRGVAIKKLPFQVGWAPAGAGANAEDRLNLAFPGASAHIDRRHFRIELTEDGRVRLRDLESRLGCFVNGRRISNLGDDTSMAAPLQFGDNRIIAGSADSPVRFNLRLSRAAA